MLKIQLYITGINYILKYVQIESSCFYKKIFHNILFCCCCIFDQINAGLVNRRDLLKKTLKILLFKNF